MFFVSDEILVPAKNDITLFASERIKQRFSNINSTRDALKNGCKCRWPASFYPKLKIVFKTKFFSI